MFYQNSASGFQQLLPGIDIKTLVYGENSLLAIFHLAKGSLLPRHSHPHEQNGYLVSGRMRFTIDQSILEANPGDAWSIPGGVYHSAEILEDSVAVEVFTPVREDYLSYLAADSIIRIP